MYSISRGLDGYGAGPDEWQERANGRQRSVGLQPSVGVWCVAGGGGTLAGPQESGQVGIEIVGTDGEFAQPLREARDLFPTKNASVLRKNRRDR